MKNFHSSHWRNDITGLRALAVLPVVIYHFFPNLIPNGFLGVDIFFVISGYLISSIIFKALNTGSFSWRDFYAKRIKRIIPPLLVVLAFTTIVGWFFLARSEYRDLAKEIFGSIFFFENFRLLGQIDYFDPGILYKPLVHIWSLAVEEQFYIFFPLVIIFLWNFNQNKKLLGILISLITFSSLLACFLISDKHFVFYFPLTRFWELSCGILLAYLEIFYQVKITGKKANLLSIFSLITILSVYWINIPGLQAPNILNFLCVITTTLLIACGHSACINKTFLSFRPMIWVGLISYSLYLWHWPLNSYLAIIYPMGGGKIKFILIIISFILAILSYRYIENPIRKLTGKKSRQAVITLFISMIIIGIISKTIRLKDGFPQRAFHQKNKYYFQFSETNLKNTLLNGVEVETTTPEQPAEILFIGDSHIQQYIDRIALLANKYHKPWAIYSLGGCLVIPGVKIKSNIYPSLCENKANKLEALLKTPSIKKVIIGQFFGMYLENRSQKYYFKDNNGKINKITPTNFNQLLNKLTSLIQTYSDKEYYFLLDNPSADNYDPNLYFSRLEPRKKGVFIMPYPKDDLWKKGNDIIIEHFKNIANFIDVASHLCPNKQCDLYAYKDDDHLRPQYLKENATWIDPIFQDLDKTQQKQENNKK